MPGNAEVWSIVRRSATTLALQAVVVTAIVGGTTAFVSLEKAVTLSVDGQKREVHTFAETIGDLLKRENISIGAHDLVAPRPEDTLTDGSTVIVRYGRPLTLTIDGQTRKVWVTATNVAEALEQLNVHAERAYISVARNMPISRAGMRIDIRLPHDVTFLVDGKRVSITTTAATVREALAQANITLGPKDQTMPVTLDAYPADGAVITVLRVQGKTVTRQEEIPFEVEEVKDSSMFEGEKKVVQEGVAGLKAVTYDLVYVNGQLKSKRKLSEKIIRKPKPQIVRVGTKENPRSVPGADDLNWRALAECESGGNPDAVNPAGPYYGLYQFDLGTWHSVGGQCKPTDYGWDEQTYRAKLLYKERGDSPWPVCGKKLYT